MVSSSPTDWEENAYTQWLKEHGQEWDDLREKISPYVGRDLPAGYHQTTWCAEKTIDFIRENKGKPWFFSFNCFDPHHPFDPPVDYLKKFDPAEMPCLPSIRLKRIPSQVSNYSIESGRTIIQRISHSSNDRL